MIRNCWFKLAVIVVCVGLNIGLPTLHSFEELAKHHCQGFDVEMMYRLASGTLAEKYGMKYASLDCYIRQFVNKDGQDQWHSEEEDQEEEEQQVQKIDPLVEEYAKGITSCLPTTVNPVEGVYAIWRFYRFILQHDYALQWIRAKIRSGLGYQSERPNAWMDGQQNQKRLRLEKLFSNQFYDYVDEMMFKPFLHPFLIYLKKNVIVAVDGTFTQSGNPMLVQYIESRNFKQQGVFVPVNLRLNGIQIFTFTIPGIPLLLGGSTGKLAWAFSGVLMDRSNIEQIETVGMKFYHYDSEQWIKLQRVEVEIPVKDGESMKCSYTHSSYGTLYEKHDSEGKNSEYIARWHQKQAKVRMVFSELLELVLQDGVTDKKLQFPFNSLVLANGTGLYHYLCFQKHPSYFLYPDLASAPQGRPEPWLAHPKKHYLVVTNTLLSTVKQQSYLKQEIHNPTEQQFSIELKAIVKANMTFTQYSFTNFVLALNTDQLIKRKKDLMIQIYRKAKFSMLPNESQRKQCDQLIAHLEKWNHDLSNELITPIYILWDYYLKDFTFNYVGATKEGKDIARHHMLSEVYWTNQIQLWTEGVSYGECSSDMWENQWSRKLWGTGLNSTCYLNVAMALNRTREVLKIWDETLRDARLSWFTSKKLVVGVDFVGEDINEIFGNYVSRSMAFSSEIGNLKVVYYHTIHERKEQFQLSVPSFTTEVQIDTTGQLSEEL